MISVQKVSDGEQRLAEMRAAVARLLVLLDNCDRERPLHWHECVRKQVEMINRLYPTNR